MRIEDATNPEQGVVGIPLAEAEEAAGMPIEAGEDVEEQPEEGLDLDLGLDLDGDGEVDIEHDGRTYRVPSALKDSFLRNADYTQKTQALANDRRALETRDAAARQHIRGYARLIALNDQIQAFETVDWAAFQQADPQGAQQQWRNLALLKEKRAGVAEDFQHREQLRALDQQRNRATQIEEGHAVLARELPEWTQGMARKIVDFGANKYGFTADEIAGIVDPRMVCVLHDAMCGHDAGTMRTKVAQIEAPGAVQAGSVNASPVTAGMLRDTDLSAYMNPYTQTVIDTSLSDLSRARDLQRVADNQAATRASAFGGSRQGVADSLTNDAYLRNVSSTSANLRNAGYDKAVSTAIADLDRALGASQFNSGQAYDAQKTNVGNRFAADQFNAGMALDVARTNTANDLAGANFRLNAAGGLAGLSGQELNMALARAGALGGVGDMQQQNQQARDDAAYDEFMRMIGYPAQQQQLRNQALGMMPVQQTSTTTTKNNPGFLDYLNTAANVAGAFK